MTPILAALLGLGLGYANGANDNFKGVATLFGSRSTSYWRALLWASGTTALGSLTALVVARGLLAAFSGHGLVAPEVLADPRFPLAVALAAGATVLLATRLGLPVSTTHALIGALVGAGLLVSPSGLNLSRLGGSFLLPLLVSPLLAILGTRLLYPPLHALRARLGFGQETCVCIGTEIVGVVPGNPGVEQALRAVRLPTLGVGTTATCRVRYQGRLFGVNVGSLLDALHFLSAGVVSLARGLNDTPKIAALLLIGHAVNPSAAVVGVGVAMAIGGLVSARRVAWTLSHRVTEMNPGQASTANVVTGLLVVGASQFGLPVSTTHVSSGALFGIGSVTGRAHWKTIGQIVSAWIVTLPMAGILSALLLWTLRPIS